MKLELKGKSVSVTGDLGTMTRADVEAALVRWGATLASAPSKKTDYFVAAKGASSGKVAKARSLGIPELTPKQLLELFQHGAIELEEAAPAPTVPLDAVIAELRGALDGAPDSARWAQIVALADKVDPNLKDAALAYIDGYISRWSPEHRRRWHVGMLTNRWDYKDSAILGDLRVMPLEWVRQALRGEHDLKHGLARAMSLSGTKANATMASAIFDSPHLDKLEILDLGHDLKLAKGFYKKLGAATNIPSLHTLIYSPSEAGAGAELAKGGGLGALRHLHIRAPQSYPDANVLADNVASLFKAPWISQLETIEAGVGWMAGFGHGDNYRGYDSVLGSMAKHAARLTSLKRLVLFDTAGLDALLQSELPDQIEELVIAGFWQALQPDSAPLEELLLRLEARGLPALKRLDLSQFVTMHYKLTHQSHRRPFPVAAALQLARRADALVIGPDADAKLRKALGDDPKIER